jgi:hypothetical protein
MPPSLLAAEGYPLTMLSADLCKLLNVHENTLLRRIKDGRDVPPWTRAGTGPKARYEWNRVEVETWWLQRRQTTAKLRRVG